MNRLHGTIARGGQRGVADLTPYEDQEKIPIGMLVRGGGGFDPFCRRAADMIPIGVYWSEGGGGFDLSCR